MGTLPNIGREWRPWGGAEERKEMKGRGTGNDDQDEIGKISGHLGNNGWHRGSLCVKPKAGKLGGHYII